MGWISSDVRCRHDGLSSEIRPTDGINSIKVLEHPNRRIAGYVVPTFDCSNPSAPLITEMDMVINSQRYPEVLTYGGGRILMHELLHTLGLNHNYVNRLTQMRDGNSAGGLAQISVGPNQAWPTTIDADHLSFLYPSSGNLKADLQVGDEFNSTTYSPNPYFPQYYQTSNVNEYIFNVSYEIQNTGNLKVSLNANFYLSTDEFITNSDYLIDQVNWTTGAAPVSVTDNKSIVFNSTSRNIPNGYYYLGILADPSNQHPETNEINNRAVLGGPYLIENN